MPSDKARFAAWAALSLVGLLIWDTSGLDLLLAQRIGGPAGFALRDNWLLSQVLHNGTRPVSWALVLALCTGVVWPVGPLARLGFARRVQLPATALLASGVVVALKSLSATSCPWDLADFGGVALHVSHWRGWVAADGGSGHCFPAGHASTGFAFVGGYFALRQQLPHLARVWLAAALAVGFALGAVQQLRGAHFMSHTLWTAWLCWMVAGLSDPLFSRPANGLAVRGAL